MCCSDERISADRVGARVDFFTASNNRARGQMVGNLLFLNPSSPTSSRATHVWFTGSSTTSSINGGNLMVSIHKSGDLTKPISESQILEQFSLPSPLSSTTHELATQLESPLSLDVGGDGIIGRRVTIHQGKRHLADGIVGFNSAPAPSVPSPLTSDIPLRSPVLVAA
ncbi:hypothetical protein V8F20_004338 [Naviculisporaceae sp. PSN 640]